MIVPLTLPQRSVRSFLLVAVLLVGVVGTAAVVVPQGTWARILTTQSQILEVDR